MTIGKPGRSLEVSIEVTRDFNTMFGFVNDKERKYNFAAPANTMEEAREATKIIYNED